MNLNEQATRLPSDYRTIPLSKGQVAIVDASDYEWLSKWKWYAQWAKDAHTFYARRDEQRNGRKRNIYMHREIVGVDSPRTDHRDGNGLHNWRANLRAATHAQNGANQRLRCTNTTGYRGVSKHACGKWMAQIVVNNKNVYLGLFEPSRAEAAARAYDAAAIKYHGEFAQLNFPK